MRLTEIEINNYLENLQFILRIILANSFEFENIKIQDKFLTYYQRVTIYQAYLNPLIMQLVYSWNFPSFIFFHYYHFCSCLRTLTG